MEAKDSYHRDPDAEIEDEIKKVNNASSLIESVSVMQNGVANSPSLMQNGAANSPSLMHNGKNLLAIKSVGDIRKYSFKLRRTCHCCTQLQVDDDSSEDDIPLSSLSRKKARKVIDESDSESLYSHVSNSADEDELPLSELTGVKTRKRVLLLAPTFRSASKPIPSNLTVYGPRPSYGPWRQECGVQATAPTALVSTQIFQANPLEGTNLRKPPGLTVSKHKTDESYGPASLFLTPEDFKMMMAYKNTCRVAQPDTTAFFTATNGNSMPSSNISDSLKSFVKRCGVNIDKVINATQIRKMWVSHFEMVGKGEADMTNIAILMKHSRETAKSWYDMTWKVGQAESAHSMIRGELSSLVAAAPPAPAFPRSSTSVQPETSGVDRVHPYDYSSVRYEWTADQIEVLRKAFKKILALDTNFRVGDVRHVFLNNADANAIWTMGRTEVWRDRCVEKVKNMWKADKAARNNKSTSF
ncbi:hypothetical protein AC249_AIPGENE418 [Exaiptasia diaphana]|nr:hypothetical protein AC249_AIPGENE418 [Exaiptasia diaphana]